MLDRRSFLRSLASVAAAGCAGVRPRAPAPRLPIAFSTLGSPAWSWAQVLDAAVENGYAAVELRSLLATENLPALPDFAPTRAAERRRELAERGLSVACASSSASLHERDPARRAAQLAEGRRYIELARSLGAPYARVFGDRFPAGEPRGEVVARVADGLRELAREAAPHGVSVLLETHGEFTDSATLLEIVRRADSPAAGILWDAHHTWVDGREAPEETVRRLGPYIRHTHLKDSAPVAGGRRYVLTGAGEVPVRRQVETLLAAGYRGLFSFEWEKRWHPEIEDPEVAIPHFARVVREYLGTPPVAR